MPGYWTNTAATALIVQPHGSPSARLEPGESARLMRDPNHPNLTPAAPEE